MAVRRERGRGRDGHQKRERERLGWPSEERGGEAEMAVRRETGRG